MATLSCSSNVRPDSSGRSTVTKYHIRLPLPAESMYTRAKAATKKQEQVYPKVPKSGKQQKWRHKRAHTLMLTVKRS